MRTMMLLLALTLASWAPAQQSVQFLVECPDPGTVPNTKCHTLKVSVAGLPDRNAQIRLTAPTTGSAMGTVMLLSGGSGAGWYAAQPGGPELVQALADLGYLVVDRRWQPPGWFTTVPGILAESERGAMLLSYVLAVHHAGGPAIVVGNSAGAAEVAYSMTTWGLENAFTGVVLCGGPPTAKLEHLCQDPPDPLWGAEAAGYFQPGVMPCGAPVLHETTSAVCQAMIAGTDPASLAIEGVLRPGALLDFGAFVHVLVGDMDCTVGAPQAMAFWDAVGSAKALEIVANGYHFMPTTEEGRDAILRAVVGAPAAAVVEWPWWPSPGEKIELSVVGTPGEAFALYAAAPAALIETPVGWWFLSAPAAPMGGGVLDSSGRGSVEIMLDNDPGLAGARFYVQVVATGGLSNVVRVGVL